MNRQETGRHGERVAARYLRRHGYRILARNYRAGHHEIDLIAKERATGVFVFVEVKTRTEGGAGRPLEAVGRQKQRFIRQAAAQWMAENRLYERGMRFDVIEVLTPSDMANHIENAF